jgi:hypothetical protein
MASTFKFRRAASAGGAQPRSDAKLLLCRTDTREALTQVGGNVLLANPAGCMLGSREAKHDRAFGSLALRSLRRSHLL